MQQPIRKPIAAFTRRDTTRWSRVSLLIGWLVGISGCGQPDLSSPLVASSPVAEQKANRNESNESTDGDSNDNTSFHPGPIRFEDVAEQSGLTFVHRSGANGGHTYPELMSGGVCLADLDADGDLDVYLPQGGAIPGDDGLPGKNGLFLNDGHGHFTDASATSNADDANYAMGAFAADIDSDGDLDLLVTNAGSIVLLANRGDATFEDVTARAGFANRDGLWLNATMADLNGDGYIDIYVANYTLWRPGVDPDCRGPSGEAEYCPPTNYDGAKDLLMFGRGDGTFEDVTDASGVGNATTRSMGVVTIDADNDGNLDLYVSVDGQSNLLWINQGNGEFEDAALIRGAALNNAGAAEASMGIACADIDSDGDEDILLTHVERETNTLYRNDGGFFLDATGQAGVGGWSRPDTGFGTGFVDFDLDGFWDLFVANGAVTRPTNPRNPEQPYALGDRVARGTPQGKFPDARSAVAESVRAPGVSRGAAFGDVDGDGRVDVIVGMLNARVQLLRNVTETRGKWLGVRPVAKKGAAVELGAVVEFIDSNRTRITSVRPHSSYLGSSEDTVRFGLGGMNAEQVTVRVTWADGTRQLFGPLGVNHIHELVREAKIMKSDGTDDEARLRQSRRTRTRIMQRATTELIRSSEIASVVQFGLMMAQAQVDSSGTSPELGPMPPLRLEKDGPLKRRVVMDHAAVATWCQRAGLPAPPHLEGLDTPTWRLVHAAIEQAGRVPSVDSLGSLAMLYDGNGVLESAALLYERLVADAPDDVKWWHLLGRVSFDLGRMERAVAALRKAALLDPENAASLGRLGEAQLSAGDAEAALHSWKQYVARRPADPIGHIGIARASESLGEKATALEAIEEALRLQPNARSALVVAARIAARKGEDALAKEYSQRAAKLENTSDPIMQDDIDLKMREHSLSVTYLRTAVEFYKEKRAFPKALLAAKQLAARRPDEAQNWQMLTWLCLALRDAKAGEKYASAAISLDPEFAGGWEAIALGRIVAKDNDKALRAINRCLEIDPDFTHGYITRGIILGGQKAWASSLVDLQKGLKAHPKDVDGLIMFSVGLANVGKKEEAATVVTRVLELSPQHPLALRLRRQLEGAR